MAQFNNTADRIALTGLGASLCASGNILLKYKTRDMNQVRGLWRVAPMTAVLFASGALALGGIPPFNVFISEFSIAVAGIYAGKTWLMVFCFKFYLLSC